MKQYFMSIWPLFRKRWKLLSNIITYDCLPRTGHDSLRRREMRLARVSMCIVLLYMICHLPKLLPTLLELIFQDPEVWCRV